MRTQPATTDRRIPVTLLTGFLGAGKTTLLNYLLQQSEMAGAAVLINEFGEVGIDHHLVDRVDETTMILDSGCICCSVQGDLVKVLRKLAERSSKREIPPVTRVLIETTGLADPVPVIYTLTQDPFVASRYRCDGVVAAVDATHATKQLDRHREAVRQVSMADLLLLTKSDLAREAQRAALHERLEKLNPGAVRIEVTQGQIDPGALFGCGVYSAGARADKVAAWLGEERTGTRLGPPGAGTHRHGERHDRSVHSFVVNFDQPVPWYHFAVAMGRTLQCHGPKLLRVKGLMNIAGDPLPRVIHCVQDVAYPPVSLPGWPQHSPFEDSRGRLVFIVRDLDGEQVEEIRSSLSATQYKSNTRPRLGSCPLNTRCWLERKLGGGDTSSSIKLEGWVVQEIHLGAKRMQQGDYA